MLLLQDWVVSYIRLFASQDGQNSEKIPLFIATMWCLWEARNELLFRGDRWLKEDVLRRVVLAMDVWLRLVSAQDTGSGADFLSSGDGPLVPPGFHFCKLGQHRAGTPGHTIQVDGAWKKDLNRAGIG